MTQWIEWFVHEYPWLTACAVMGIFIALFWFLFIYDFPERLFRKWMNKENKDDDYPPQTGGGYNPFD